MQPSSPLPVNQVDVYRPACSKCGSRMMLARIEPSGRSDYDTRTFECGQCGHELRRSFGSRRAAHQPRPQDWGAPVARREPRERNRRGGPLVRAGLFLLALIGGGCRKIERVE